MTNQLYRQWSFIKHSASIYIAFIKSNQFKVILFTIPIKYDPGTILNNLKI